LLVEALDHRLDLCCGRVLKLLRAQGYDADVIERATHAMRMGDPDWRSRAFAILEPALTATHRDLLSFFAKSKSEVPSSPSTASRDERLLEIALGRYSWASSWVRGCALRALNPSNPRAADTLNRAASDPDACIAETAAEVLAASKGHSHANGADSVTYSLLTKVTMLRDVSLFTTTPHEDLVGVANLLTERRALPGERILQKGDLGDCLYIIATGKVRVHDGDRTLAHLGNKDVFGELSLLDAEPRSASVSAVDATHLFRLEQNDFYNLIGERPQIVRAVSRALCRMLRRTSNNEPR
jgi:hypothetical protein